MAVRRPGGRRTAVEPVAGSAPVATIRIDAPNRWDALDLARGLPRCNWFLIERDPRHWEVCVRSSPRRLRLIRALTGAARDWAERRGIESVIHLPDGDLTLGRRRDEGAPPPC